MTKPKPGAIYNRIPNSETLTIAERKRLHDARYRASPKGLLQKAKRRGPALRRQTLRKYGINHQEYLKLLASQGGGCALCSRSRDSGGSHLAVDHAHDTNTVRGILCKGCNARLGAFGDDPARLEQAAAYLRASPARVQEILGRVPSCSPEVTRRKRGWLKVAA